MAGGQSIRCQVVSSKARSLRCTLAGRSGLRGRVRNDSVPSALPWGLRSKVNDARPVATPNGGSCRGSVPGGAPGGRAPARAWRSRAASSWGWAGAFTPPTSPIGGQLHRALGGEEGDPGLPADGDDDGHQGVVDRVAEVELHRAPVVRGGEGEGVGAGADQRGGLVLGVEALVGGQGAFG